MWPQPGRACKPPGHWQCHVGAECAGSGKHHIVVVEAGHLVGSAKEGSKLRLWKYVGGGIVIIVLLHPAIARAAQTVAHEHKFDLVARIAHGAC